MAFRRLRRTSASRFSSADCSPSESGVLFWRAVFGVNGSAAGGGVGVLSKASGLAGFDLEGVRSMLSWLTDGRSVLGVEVLEGGR